MTDPPLKPKCTISWCNSPALANHLCKKHYRRQRRKGQAVHLDHPDVKGVLEVGAQVLSFTESLVLKGHKANGHKLAFEVCDSGSWKEFHSLKLLYASKEEVNNDPQDSAE